MNYNAQIAIQHCEFSFLEIKQKIAKTKEGKLHEIIRYVKLNCSPWNTDIQTALC